MYPLLEKNQQANMSTTEHQNVYTSQPIASGSKQYSEDANATSKATAKAGAYGGAELGSAVGNSICCCCGGIIGNCIGEKYGERAVNRSGLQERAGKIRNKVGNVIGEENVDKAGEIALTAFGYGDDQFCACFPCMPSSQILIFIMFAFYIYNWYRLVIGIKFELGCSQTAKFVRVVNFTTPEHNETNINLAVKEGSESNNSDTNNTLVEYPCEFGFDYMTVGATIWMIYLPFYIVTLLGNCWRQCCCCLCDPLVCFATICDFFKRCLCECGKFSCIDLVWYTMCTFQVIWGFCGLYWLVDISYLKSDRFNFKTYVDPNGELLKNVLASVILDIILAGSELFHKALRIWHQRLNNQAHQEEYELQQELK